MDKLIELLELDLDYARRWAEDSKSLANKAFDQAFGALEMFCLLHPEMETACADLWENKYFPAFEEIIFGC